MKKERQSLILSLIAENEIETQEELQQLLRERGYEVTQATISRDINELKIKKDNSDGGYSCYSVSSKHNPIQYNNIISQAVVEMDYAQNIVCIKCHSGLANAACAVLDSMALNFIVGTIAGDDTIFVLVRSEKHAVQLIEELKKML